MLTSPPKLPNSRRVGGAALDDAEQVVLLNAVEEGLLAELRHESVLAQWVRMLFITPSNGNNHSSDDARNS
jgi:hypothetical protein